MSRKAYGALAMVAIALTLRIATASAGTLRRGNRRFSELPVARQNR
jgi:hypothetical protein